MSGTILIRVVKKYKKISSFFLFLKKEWFFEKLVVIIWFYNLRLVKTPIRTSYTTLQSTPLELNSSAGDTLSQLFYFISPRYQHAKTFLLNLRALPTFSKATEWVGFVGRSSFVDSNFSDSTAVTQLAGLLRLV